MGAFFAIRSSMSNCSMISSDQLFNIARSLGERPLLSLMF